MMILPHGNLSPWYFDTLGIGTLGQLDLWDFVPWYRPCGTFALWDLPQRNLAPWDFDPMGNWTHGSLTPMVIGPMVDWIHGRLAIFGPSWPLLAPSGRCLPMMYQFEPCWPLFVCCHFDFVWPFLTLFKNNMPQLKMRSYAQILCLFFD